MGKHYVYQHIRLDKNQVFYVGIGTKSRGDNDYWRSKSKERNIVWERIVKKTDYKIEILCESDYYNDVKAIEMFLIYRYGLLSDRSGILANLTLGGDGILGFHHKTIIKRVYLYESDGSYHKGFNSHIDCARYLGVSRSSISNSVNETFLIKGYIIKDYISILVEPVKNIKEKLSDRLSKAVYQFNGRHIFIKKYKNSLEAEKETGITGSHIRECASGSKYRHSAGGFIWKYNR